jgi:hypothetical protein
MTAALAGAAVVVYGLDFFLTPSSRPPALTHAFNEPERPFARFAASKSLKQYRGISQAN